MAVYDNGAGALSSTFGKLVRNPGKLVVTNSTKSLFTIANGPVIVTALVGIVSVAIPNTASLTAKVVHTPSGGSAGDLSAATGITDDAIGTIYTLPVTGLAADLLSEITAAGSEAPGVTYGLVGGYSRVLRAGVVGLTVSNHTSSPGAIDWYLAYAPLTTGATVTAA